MNAVKATGYIQPACQ